MTSKAKLKLVDTKPKLHALVYDLDINDYHSGTSRSSSQFKDLLDDEDVFVAKHVHKTIERQSSPAFDVGTYFHTGVLEPHKLKKDCVVFPGKTRRGGMWDRFKAKYEGKATIVTEAQKKQAEGLVHAVGNSEVAEGYLDGEPEVSLFIEISIYYGGIYATHFGMRLTRDGWVKDSGGAKLARKKGYNFVVKVRADMLGETYISDLKSTGGNARSNAAMQDKVVQYQYDLSAALYMDMFRLLRPDIFEFIWIFASKDLFNSKSYRASAKSILVGRAKYMRAMIKLSDLAANNWETMDYLDEIEPTPRDLGYLEEKDSDLL